MGTNVTDVGYTKKTSEHELKKHAATIHCSNTLSLLQRKISNALLYHAYKELMLKEEHEITVKQLCRLIGYNGNNHSVIKEGLKGLLSTVIEWNLVSDTTGEEDWTASSILASVSLKGPVCFYAYSPRMKQLLHSPSMFGKINLFIQSRFKSSYGLALYENCIRYRGLPTTKWFEMDTFRKLMGVPAGKYTIFRDFKKRVLDKSIEEVNAYSDLIIESEMIKEGRQVIKVRFNLKERAKKIRLGGGSKIQALDEQDKITTLKGKLTSHFGLSSEQVESIFTEFEENYIVDKISMIEASNSYKQGKIQNLGGFLISALKNNYLQSKNSKNIKNDTDSEKHFDIKEKKRITMQMREAYLVYREQVIDREFVSLSEKDKETLLQRFFLETAEPINTILRVQRNKYTRETVMNSPQIKALLRQFVLHEIPTLQDKLLSQEQFSELYQSSEKQDKQTKIDNG